MAFSGIQDVTHLLRVGMRILPQPVTHAANGLLQTFLACSRFWLLVYAAWLLIMDMFFTIFPTTIIFVCVLSLFMHYTKLPGPPSQFVHAVLGLNPNVQSPESVATSSNKVDALRDFASSAFQSALGAFTIAGGGSGQQYLMDFATRKLQQKGKENARVGFATPVPDALLEFETVAVKDKVTVIARRGAGQDVPENSLGAFEYCKQKGCHVVQFDVRLSADNVAVVFHDDDLIRMGGMNRKVKEMTVLQIKRVLLTEHAHSTAFKRQRIPDLEAAVEKCIELNLKFILNIVDPDDAVSRALLEP